ncbi:hypothetical protein [Paenibacillus qinlingensis]|uniref:ATP-binding protein n=1 Tax=Paenibacillus qinlingensis TaxID=1837343 RepID=A0ABU1NPT5_9BACL|nr:hypothetical protein [Paenibacillus qinlingensis]MDR6549032.1 hypothetical protein [Paenibacillus qinlingensis]
MSKLASSFQTGSGGGTFEHKVKTLYLINGLICGRVAFFPEGKLEKMRFQAKEEGYQVDDIVIWWVVSETGDRVRWLGQIKHTIAITKNDKEFRKFLADAWADFNNCNLFDRTKDKIVLVTGPLSAKILNHLRPIINWARDCNNETEFISKVNRTHGFSSKEKEEYLQIFEHLLTEANGSPIDDRTLWEFLKCFYLVTYDLDYLSDSKDYDQLIAHLSLYLSVSNNETVSAREVWSEVFKYVSEADQNSSIISEENMDDSLKRLFRGTPLTQRVRKDLIKLQSYSEEAFRRIKDSIGSEVRLTKEIFLETVTNQLQNSDAIVVTGEPMVGKSVILKLLKEHLSNNNEILLFALKSFNGSSFDNFLKNHGVEHSLKTILLLTRSKNNNYIFIDGLEHALSEEKRQIVNDIIATVQECNEFIFSQGGNQNEKWKIVFTCRSQEANHLIPILKTKDLMFEGSLKKIELPNLSEEEISHIVSHFPKLHSLLSQTRIQQMIWRPAILDLITLPSAEFDYTPAAITEVWLRKWFWERIVKKDRLFDERESVLLTVAESSLKKQPVLLQELNKHALKSLIEDRILTLNDNELRFTHDVLEEWALVSIMDRNKVSIRQLISDSKSNLLLLKPLTLYCCKLVELDNKMEAWFDILGEIESAEELALIWRHAIYASVFELTNIGEFISQVILSKKFTVLHNLLKVLRNYCVDIDREMSNKTPKIHFSIKVHKWEPVVEQVINYLDQLDDDTLYQFSFTAREWMRNTVGNSKLRIEICNTYSLYISGKRSVPLNEKKCEELLKNTADILVWSADTAPELTKWFLQQKLPGAVKAYLEYRIFHEAWSCLCRYIPDEALRVVTDIVINRNLSVTPMEDDSFGINQLGIKTPSYLVGPFKGFLEANPIHGLQLINNIINYATENWRKRQIKSSKTPIVQSFVIVGMTKQLWGDSTVYCWYRYSLGVPPILTSCLMALEQWIYDRLNDQDDPDELFKKIFEKTNSVAILGVCASVCLDRFEENQHSIRPLFNNSTFWHLDYERFRKMIKSERDIDTGLFWNKIVKDEHFLILSEIDEKFIGDASFYAAYLANTKKDREMVSHAEQLPENLPFFFEEEKTNKRMIEERTQLSKMFSEIVRKSYEQQSEDEDQGQLEGEEDAVGLLVIDADRVLDRFWSWTTTFFQENEIGRYFTLESGLNYAMDLENQDDITYVPYGYFFREKEVIIADSLVTFASALVYFEWEWVVKHDLKEWCIRQITTAVKRPDIFQKYKKIGNMSVTSEINMGYLWAASLSLPILALREPDNEEIQQQMYKLAQHDNNLIRENLFTSMRYLWGTSPDLVWSCINITMIQAAKKNKLAYNPWTMAKSLFIRFFNGKEIYTKRFYKYPLDYNYVFPIAFSLPDYSYISAMINIERYDKFLQEIYFFTITTKMNNFSFRQMSEERNWVIQVYYKIAHYFVGHPSIEKSTLYMNMFSVHHANPNLKKAVLDQMVRVAHSMNDETFRIVFLKNWILICRTLLVSNSKKKNLSLIELFNLMILIRPTLPANAPNIRREPVLELQEWGRLSMFRDFITMWCESVGNEPACFNNLLIFLNTVGNHASYIDKINWVYVFSFNQLDLYTDGEFADRTVTLLYGIWSNYKSRICSSPKNFNKFALIVERLVEQGDRLAIRIHTEILDLNPLLNQARQLN